VGQAVAWPAWPLGPCTRTVGTRPSSSRCHAAMQAADRGDMEGWARLTGGRQTCRRRQGGGGCVPGAVQGSSAAFSSAAAALPGGVGSQQLSVRRGWRRLPAVLGMEKGCLRAGRTWQPKWNREGGENGAGVSAAWLAILAVTTPTRSSPASRGQGVLLISWVWGEGVEGEVVVWRGKCPGAGFL
jgi:hypothetical protein